MSLTSLGSLLNLAGFTKGKGKATPAGTVIAGAASLLLASASPLIIGLVTAVSPTSGALAFSGPQPTISANNTQVASAGALSLTGPVPTVDTGGVTSDIYTVNSLNPDVVADFERDYFRVGGSVSDFPTMFSGYTTRSDLATMVDSDGNLKWCPHNLVLYSEQFDNAWWSKTNTSITANSTTAPDGNSTADTVTDTSDGSPVGHEVYRATGFPSSPKVGEVVTWAVYAKYSNIQYIVLTPNRDNFYANFDIQNGTVGNTGSNATASITDCGSGWYLCKVTWTIDSTINPRLEIFLATSDGTTRTPTYTGAGTGVVYLWGAHAYRSDLGGMVNVPSDMRAAAGANFATYVSTTTAAKYLQRRGNHVYNGFQWIKEGIQLETEARTNLITSSNTLDSGWWAVEFATATKNVTGPDGVSNGASTIADLNTGGTGVVGIRNTAVTVSTSTTYTFSVFAKASGVDYIAIGLEGFTTPANGASYFNLSTGAVVSSGSGQTTNIIDYGGGWYRCCTTFTTDASDTSGLISVRLSENGTSVVVNRDGTSSVLMYGSQLEVGSTPSSYIPTSGATVSRAADSLQIPAANMSHSTSAVSLQMNGTMTFIDGNSGTQVGNFSWESGSQNIRFYADTDRGTGGFTFSVNDGSPNNYETGGSIYTPGVDVAYNVAGRVTTTETNVAAEGTAGTASDSGDVPSVSAGNAIFGAVSTVTMLGNIGLFRQWDADLGDTGIATASLPIDDYAVSQYQPLVVADFVNDYYRVGGNVSDYSTMFSGYTTRSNLATMVDSDGYIKWCPHNQILYSDDFSNALWSKANFSYTTGQADIWGGTDGILIEPASSADSKATLGGAGITRTSDKYTYALYAKYVAGNGWLLLFPNGNVASSAGAWFDIQNGTVGTEQGGQLDTRITSAGGGWYLCEIDYTDDGTAGTHTIEIADANGSSTGDAGDQIVVCGISVYRSSLGGMVDNPEYGDHYVPTTSAAVYLQRRGNHVYNGTSWVNKGIQIETEARTNLITASEDMSGWTNSNTTDTKNQTGPDGNANSATLVSATAGNGTILLTVTAATNPHIYSALVKRVTGTGTVEMTVNGGTNWVDITSLINSSVYTAVGTTPGTSTTNPQVGFRIVTSGDAIAVAGNQLEQTSGQFSSRIPTSGSTVTRAADSLQIPAANHSYNTTAISFQMDGIVTYSDNNLDATVASERGEIGFCRWSASALDFNSTVLVTANGTGGVVTYRENTNAQDRATTGVSVMSPGVDVAFNFAARHTSSAVNIAFNGTASTADTSVTAMANLTAQNLVLAGASTLTGASNGTMNISQFRQWDVDLGDTGIETAST